MLDHYSKYFEMQLTRNHDGGFCLGFEPIWIHKHFNQYPNHFHMLFNLGFWFFEIRVGRDYLGEDQSE